MPWDALCVLPGRGSHLAWRLGVRSTEWDRQFMADQSEDLAPDPSGWQPRTKSEDSLAQAFFHRCEGVEQILLLRAQLEKKMNIDNFDSGMGVEDIFREELAKILPRRYSVRAGVLSDSTGKSAGDCDVVIFNDTWFPSIKAGATEGSRRWHFPIEGAYGVVEIKQTLSAATLDEAMKKLVIASRLGPPSADDQRDVENRPSDEDPATRMQPMFTAVVAMDLEGDLEDIVGRFIRTNGQLPRRQVVNALCVLGHGFVTWGYEAQPPPIPPQTAFFTSDEEETPLFPLFVRGPEICSLYELVTVMLGHIYGRVLPAEDVAVLYGANQKAQRPLTEQWDMQPDAFWIAKTGSENPWAPSES